MSHKNYVFFVIWILSFVIFTAGCANIKEAAKGFAGISTKVLEDTRKDAVVKSFNFDYNTCYTVVKDTLKKHDAYIYAEDAKKKMIAIYVSSSDTTPVGIFFTELGPADTQIEVSSPSTYARDLIAKIIFTSFEKPVSSKEEEGVINETK